MKTKTVGLTARQAAFVEAYITDPERNAERAAKAAGFKQHGWRVAKLPNVAAEIAKRSATVSERANIDAVEVLKVLERQSRATLADFLVDGPDGHMVISIPNGTSRERLAGLAQVETESYVEPGEDGQVVKKIKIKVYDPRHAAETLGRHLGVLKDGKSRDDGDPSKAPSVPRILIVDGEEARRLIADMRAAKELTNERPESGGRAAKGQ